MLTPELSLWGYPPRDLLLRPSLVARQEKILDQLAAELVNGPAVLVGVAEPIGGCRVPSLHNALALVARGGVADRLPQTVAAHLRRLRRAALLPPRPEPRRCWRWTWMAALGGWG